MYTYKILLTFVGIKASSGHISCHASSVNNPVYVTGNTVPQTTTPAGHNMSSPITEQLRDVDNPIYDDNEPDQNVYTVPSDHRDLSGMRSVPDYLFDNTIYGTETVENSYPIPNSPAAYDTVVDMGQKEHETINGVNE